MGIAKYSTLFLVFTFVYMSILTISPYSTTPPFLNGIYDFRSVFLKAFILFIIGLVSLLPFLIGFTKAFLLSPLNSCNLSLSILYKYLSVSFIGESSNRSIVRFCRYMFSVTLKSFFELSIYFEDLIVSPCIAPPESLRGTRETNIGFIFSVKSLS